MKGQKTDVEVVEKIKCLMASGKTQSETARLCGIADNTVKNIMNKLLSTEEGKQEFAKLQKEKKKQLQEEVDKEFKKTMKESFERLFNKSIRVIDKAIDENTLSPREAITLMGTTFDKHNLMAGGKTANVNISFDEVLEKINEGNEY